MLKIACLDDAFSEAFEPQASPVEGQSLQQKKKREKEKKERRKKKIPKIEKIKDVGHFVIQKNVIKILIFGHARVTMHYNVMLVASKASCCVANAFSTGLKVIWPRSSLKITKMSKKRTFCKTFQELMGLSHDPIFQKMGPFVINLENLSKLRPEMPEILKNLDFRFFC